MSRFIIEGQSKLAGNIKVSGSKNAALPIIAATILASGKYVIDNVPQITDIYNLLAILEGLGAKTELVNNVCTIDTTELKDTEPDPRKVRNIRASILLAGPLLARFGKVKLAHPGGCFIGARPVGTHFRGFEALGATITTDQQAYTVKAQKLFGKKIILDEISVTGTENVVMAACLATGTTEIRLCATEPHVEDLCHFLHKMGAKIEGIGTHTLIIQGQDALHPTDYTLIPDQIEAGTFVLLAAAARGEVTIEGFVPEHHDILLNKLYEANVNFRLLDNNRISVSPSTLFKAVNIRTDIYPNFPTDLQAPFAVLMTQAEGTSEIYETMFEGRLNYINELNKMGANGVIRNSRQASITGPTPLFGTTIKSLDLRAGATLIIAAIVASGESQIENIELIDRGYENIESKLTALGAKIKRIEAAVVK